MVRALRPVRLPEGLFRNGTSYQAKDRWNDASLVRWHDGALRPIGGWGRKTNNTGAQISNFLLNSSTEVIRNMFAWRANDGGTNLAVSSNSLVYVIDADGSTYQVIFASGTSAKDTVSFDGYGKGGYGYGPYGVTYDMQGRVPTPVTRAAFGSWGELLLLAADKSTVTGAAPMREYDPVTNAFSATTGVPECNDFIVTTTNRQVFAVGTDGEPRRIRTSDVEDRNTWTAATDNQVIDRTLAGEGTLLRCIEVLNSVLILGEKDLYRAEYVRPPLVWSTRPIGNNCGLITSDAVAHTDDFAVWWGDRAFWIFDGALKPLACDVIDYLYEDINLNQRSKIRAMVNSQYSEVWWLYQSNDGTDTDSYVYWNYAKRHWGTGKIDRTAGIDKGVLPFVTMVGSDGLLYNHELEFVLPSGGDIYATTGPLELGEGDNEMCVHQIFPDNECGCDTLQYTFYAKQLPGLNSVTFGPYQNDNPTGTTGVAGRQIQMRVDFLKSQTEHGHCRLEVSPGGGRG